jgi:hypothetical protein
MLGNREERATVSGNPAINVARVRKFAFTTQIYCLIDLKNRGTLRACFVFAGVIRGNREVGAPGSRIPARAWQLQALQRALVGHQRTADLSKRRSGKN